MDDKTRADIFKLKIDSRTPTPDQARAIEDNEPLNEADYAQFDRLFGSKNPAPAPGEEPSPHDHRPGSPPQQRPAPQESTPAPIDHASAAAAKLPGPSARVLVHGCTCSCRTVTPPAAPSFDGYASAYEVGYDMDFWGPYTEIVDAGAGAKSLAQEGLDVPLRATAPVPAPHRPHHHPRTARSAVSDSARTPTASTSWHPTSTLPTTTSPTSPPSPQRPRRRDELHVPHHPRPWSPDYTEYRIHEYDIHRGDVAIVGYGQPLYPRRAPQPARPPRPTRCRQRRPGPRSLAQLEERFAAVVTPRRSSPTSSTSDCSRASRDPRPGPDPAARQQTPLITQTLPAGEKEHHDHQAAINKTRAEINAKIARYNDFTGDINKARSEGADEASLADQIAARDAVKAEQDALTAKLRTYEADDAQEQEVQRAPHRGREHPHWRTHRPARSAVESPSTSSAPTPRTTTRRAATVRDVAAAALGDFCPAQRIGRHVEEERGPRRARRPEVRGITTGVAPGTVVPQYLIDMYASRGRPGRHLADMMRKHELSKTDERLHPQQEGGHVRRRAGQPASIPSPRATTPTPTSRSRSAPRPAPHDVAAVRRARTGH